MTYGYNRLEQATLHLKRQRSWIKIVERHDIDQLTNEQRWQLSGRVGDDNVVRIGKWLGANSLLLFRIEGPTIRERMLARFYGRMPPFVVSSKIVSVESGEVLYDDIITAMAVPESGEWDDYASDYELQPALRAVLDQALSAAIVHLHQISVRNTTRASLLFSASEVICLSRQSTAMRRDILTLTANKLKYIEKRTSFRR